MRTAPPGGTEEATQRAGGARPTSRDIRTGNRYRLLRQALAGSPVSRPRLAHATGLSAATVAAVVTELLDAGLLVEAGFEDSAGGRPRGLLAVNPRGGVLVGVDVAETYVRAEAFDLALAPVARAERQLGNGEREPARVADHVAAAVDEAARRGAGPGTPVLGAGVSMPGLVDRAGGVSVLAANWDWRRVPLRELLADRLPYPLYLDNPLRACVVAEQWFGAARGREDAVVVNLGTGVGAGLALGGRLYRGASDSAGEWGHTTLVPDGRRCACGRRGCVETYVGAPGIMRQLRERSPRSPLLRAGDQTATVAALGRACRAGDPVATEVVRATAAHLGAALADLVRLLDPEVVVLSSWVARLLGAPLLLAVRAELTRHALAWPRREPEVVLSEVPGNPVCLGAAALALEGALSALGRAP